jgi:hypothetical protein
LGGGTIGSPPSFLDFSANIGDYIDTSHTGTADEAGTNRIFIQVHNRAIAPIAGSDVRVLLLLTDAAAGLPPLPADYATRIIAGDTTNWVAGSSWRFADVMTPYRTPSSAVDARASQVVYYDVDFSTMALPAGHNHVCAAAFVTSVSGADRLLDPGNTSLDALTMIDRHVAHRNLHLVPAGARPVPGRSESWQHEAQTIIVDFHNALREEAEIEVVVDRREMVGPLSMMLPKVGVADVALDGWRRTRAGALPEEIATQAASFLERLGEAIEGLGERLELAAKRILSEPAIRDEREVRLRKLEGIDRSIAYVADGNAATPAISGIRIPGGGHITAAITMSAPDKARPGDEFRFDVLQRQKGRIVGGSTYVLAVFDRRR